jgi:HK97 family phage major capsid protein
MINFKELRLLLSEYNSLTNKVRLSKADESRCAYLQTAIAAVKSGVSLAEMDQQELNDRESRAGVPLTLLPDRSKTDNAEVRAWQGFVAGERRDMVEGGNLSAQLGTYTGLGYFVPSEFFPELFRALKAHDALFDEDSCTLIKTTNGRPLPVPLASDTEHTASVVGEAESQTSVDFDATGHAVLGAFSYCSDRYVASVEAFQDLETALTAVALAKEFFEDKLARGIGADLVNGTGTTKPLGLLPALEALGVPVITAQGDSETTGNAVGEQTGANSIGVTDCKNAIDALDTAYLESPKCAWLCNRHTLAFLSGILDRYGRILNLVKWVDNEPFIFGVPVKISPSMPSIGVSTVPIVLGDFRYWATRLVTEDDAIGLKVYKEAPGLIEKGNIGIRCFMRADGALLYSDVNAPSPFIPIQCFS